MAISNVILDLYARLRGEKVLSGTESVAELGSQTVYSDENTLTRLFSAFGHPLPINWQIFTGPEPGTCCSRLLYEYLGFPKFDCIDIDANFGALTLDLNFDDLPLECMGAYDLVTNIGTAEHILDQFNTFKTIHDLTRPGGLMLSLSPFIGCYNHGFFNIQPNFYEALARFNSYETLGTWINSTSDVELISWKDTVNVNVLADYVLIVLTRRTHDRDFAVPIQACYEHLLPRSSRERYRDLEQGEMSFGTGQPQQ